MPIHLKQSTASQEVPIGPFLNSTDGNTTEAGLTIANTDIKVWKAGATTLANKNSGGGTHISGGIYYAVLDATDTDTLGSLVIFCHVSGALAVRVECVVLAANVYDSLIGGGDLLDVSVVQLNGGAQSLTDLKDFADDGYDPVTNKVQGVVLTDTVTTYTGDTPQTGDSFARIGATGSGLTSLATQASVNAVDDLIDTEVGAIKTVVDAIEVDTQDIQARLPAALVSGRIDSSVGANQAGVDFTAAMKTSLDAATPAVTVSDKTGFSLSGAGVQAIWDAATSALTTVGSIGKWILDKLDVVLSTRLSTAGYTAPPTASQNADAVWDETLADHLTAGSTGAGLNAAGSSGDPWATAVPGAYGAGSAGKILGDNLNATVGSRSSHSAADVWASGTRTLSSFGTLVADVATAVWESATRTLSAFGFTVATNSDSNVTAIKAKTDNLPASPAAVGSAMTLAADSVSAAAIAADAVTEMQSGLATQTLLTTVAGYLDTEIGAIKAKTDLIPASPAAVGDIPTANANADALLDRSNGIETSITLRQAQRVQLASAAGKLSGAATTTVAIRNPADTKDRITATVDASGNRSAVTLDVT